MSDTHARLTKLVAEHLCVDIEKVVPEALIAADEGGAPNLGGDSLDLLEVVMAVEDEFDLHIEDQETDAVKTVADLFALVDSKLAPVAG